MQQSAKVAVAANATTSSSSSPSVSTSATSVASAVSAAAVVAVTAAAAAAAAVAAAGSNVGGGGAGGGVGGGGGAGGGSANNSMKAPQPQSQPSMEHANTGNISRSSLSTKAIDRIHFAANHHQQQSTATSSTTVAAAAAAAPVITVIAPSSQQATDMISSQPVVVQVPGGNQYITVEVPNDTNAEASVTQANVTPGDDGQDERQNHTNFDDYNSVYSNGSNSAGQISFYTEPYQQTYYNTTGVSIQENYLVMDSVGNAEHSLPVGANCVAHHRESSQNEEYNKTYQQPRMSVQPQTMEWLLHNYETAEGVSLPRSTLYSHYLEHCAQYNMEPVNAASFGKLIRSVFIGLKTRRLGTRGNSKYHYYGIRIKPGSTLERGPEGMNGGAGDQGSGPPTKRSKNSQHGSNKCEPIMTIPNASSTADLMKHLGDSSRILSTYWPPPDANNADKLVTGFLKAYRAHYERIIKALAELRFMEIEVIWRQFWQAQGGGTQVDCLDVERLKALTKSSSSLVGVIEQIDYSMYNALITHLFLPDLLKSIPQVLTQQIRNFAKCIYKWMLNALDGYGEDFVRMKSSAVSALSHMLRRYTSLNHLSSAAQAVLINGQQVAQMISDLNKVDFKNVQEQAAWVCQCDDELVHKVECSFKDFLQGPSPAQRWSCWCEQVLEMCLSSPSVSSAKDFFFKWEFYSSLVMRDLTLRSAASFGSFHLIRLLYDEYIFYLIEQRIAKATGTTPLQMLGGNRQLMLSNNVAVSTTTTTTSVPTTTTNNNNNNNPTDMN